MGVGCCGGLGGGGFVKFGWRTRTGRGRTTYEVVHAQKCCIILVEIWLSV